MGKYIIGTRKELNFLVLFSIYRSINALLYYYMLLSGFVEKSDDNFILFLFIFNVVNNVLAQVNFTLLFAFICSSSENSMGSTYISFYSSISNLGKVFFYPLQLYLQ